MNRRVSLLVFVVFVAALSGCSVILDGGGSPEPTATPTPLGETESDRSTATPSPTESAGATTPATTETPPAGESAGSERQTFDAAALNDRHVTALEAEDGFTTQTSLVIRNASTTQYINGTHAVERDGPAITTGNVTFVGEGGSVDDRPTILRYTESETTYERRVERTDDGVETEHRRGTEPYSADDPAPVNRTVAYTLGEIARDVIDDSVWNQTGGGEFDGAAVTRYDTSGEQFGAHRSGAAGGATLVIDEDGVVRYIAYRFVTDIGGERTEFRYEAAYTGVGETTVEEPAWTDRT